MISALETRIPPLPDLDFWEHFSENWPLTRRLGFWGRLCNDGEYTRQGFGASYFGVSGVKLCNPKPKTLTFKG